jgi:hypothetical protein
MVQEKEGILSLHEGAWAGVTIDLSNGVSILVGWIVGCSLIIYLIEKIAARRESGEKRTGPIKRA